MPRLYAGIPGVVGQALTVVHNRLMATVTLARALKEKNRLVKQVKTLREQIAKYNSVVAGSDKPFDVPERFADYERAAMRLAKLKAAIQGANAPIYGHITEMAELRGMVAFLQMLDTKSGRNVYGYQGEIVEYEVALDALKVEAELSRIEARLDDLQDQVDAFNSSTKLEIPD